jgi:CheY-like chemotaxis protein
VTCDTERKPSGRKRILLVDDDDDIRRLMRAFLESDGYEVFSCRNAMRALEVFAARPDIDLLLTDLQMPLMSGFELGMRLMATRPGLPVIIVSGAVMTQDLLGRIAANGWDLRTKPCRVPDLLGVIANRLTGRPEPAVAA